MQQLKIVEDFVNRNHIKTKVIGCKTIRDKNGVAYSSRNFLLSNNEMIIASKISLYEGFIKDHQLDNIINLIDSFGLDTDYSKYKFSVLKKYIFNDKKVADGKLNLILIDEKFRAFKTSKFDQNNIKKAFI